jgi:hypothetical protein
LFAFNNDRVATVRHALALDEHRVMFVQNLWNPSAPTTLAKRQTDVLQVWFAGVHADIGGGYPEAESGLSRITLAWMRDQAAATGLSFRPMLSARMLTGEDEAPADTETVVKANVTALAHDELASHRSWYLLEWLPVPRWQPDGEGGWKRRWQCHRGRPRNVPAGAWEDFSVDLRRKATGYKPRPTLI